MSRPSVSVVIPCYNGERHLRTCLEGLTRQTYPAYEIVVVDDASIDGTLRVLEEFPQVKVVLNAENRGPAFSRNRGIDASGGDVLLFLDADCAVEDPTWISKHVQARAPRTVVGGGIVGRGRGIVARADSYCHWYTNIPYSQGRATSRAVRGRRIRFSRHLVTTNMSLPRNAMREIGPFDEDLRTGEDVEFCERAILQGWTLRLEPEIIAYHHDRERFGDFFGCFYRVGQDRVPARRRHQSQYYRLLPIGVVSGLFLCVPIGLLGPLQPIRAWWPYDKRVVLYYPLIAVASFGMALGIVRYWADRTVRDG